MIARVSDYLYQDHQLAQRPGAAGCRANTEALGQKESNLPEKVAGVLDGDDAFPTDVYFHLALADEKHLLAAAYITRW